MILSTPLESFHPTTTNPALVQRRLDDVAVQLRIESRLQNIPRLPPHLRDCLVPIYGHLYSCHPDWCFARSTERAGASLPIFLCHIRQKMRAHSALLATNGPRSFFGSVIFGSVIRELPYASSKGRERHVDYGSFEYILNIPSASSPLV